MKKNEHHLLLTWLVLTGIIFFGFYVSWQEGIFHLLYGSDKSYISFAITLIYILITFHCAIRVWYVSNQANIANKISQTIKDQNSLKLSVNGDVVAVTENESLPQSITSEYIHDLVTRNANQQGSSENDQDKAELIEIYESKLKGPDEIGWFATDAMIKLGLLGTIIGFILMLASVVNITEFDVATMQKILSHMSAGMGTALYTTMSGLICSLLAAAQYHMIDRNIDEIINSLKHLAQVHIIPKLN